MSLTWRPGHNKGPGAFIDGGDKPFK